MLAVLVLLCLYMIFYLSVVRKPRIICQKSTFNINLVKKIRVLNICFWPFLVYGFGYLQSKLYQYRPRPGRKYKSIHICAKDGEMISLDVYDVDTEKSENVIPADVPAVHNVVLVHGFNGTSHSSYIECLAYHLKKYRVFAFNARGANSELRTPVFFHIGWTADLEATVNYILQNYTGSVSLVGFSMGSSWVTNYLGRFDNPRVVAGVGVCVPFSFMRLRNMFKSTIKAKMMASLFRMYLSKHRVFDSFNFDFNDVEEIDKHVTSKVFGFESTEEYYKKESCESQLCDIRKPMLFINSYDDPIIPCASIPVEKIKKNPNLILCMTKSGGHLGFLGHNWYTSFVDNAVADFLAELA